MICRDGLDHLPLSPGISDSDLRPMQCYIETDKAHDNEAALCKTVADIQIKLGLSVNDHRCKK